MPTTIAVTGSSGFIGSALVAALCADPRFRCRAISRRALPIAHTVPAYAVGDLEDGPDLSAALRDVDVVMHTAGRAHVQTGSSSASIQAYHSSIEVGTQKLVEATLKAGVRRLVFLSTAAVHGETSPIDRPFTEADALNPATPYAASKIRAERFLRDTARNSGLEVVILRPPLVYGPGVKGNLLRLIRLVKTGVPLPFGAISNLRSLIALENLITAMTYAALHPAAAGQTFLVSDQRDISTPELIRLLASGLECQARLFPVPPPVLEIAGRLVGARAMIRRLTLSLRVDSSAMSASTAWRPTDRLAEGLRGMASSSSRTVE